MTMEQWTTVLPHPDGGVAGWSLTASVATAEYPSLADLFAYVAVAGDLRDIRPRRRGRGRDRLFDTATGRLRLDRASVDALLAWVDGGAPAPEAMAALTAAGVVDSGGPHPVLLPVLDAITEAGLPAAARARRSAVRHRVGDGRRRGGAAAAARRPARADRPAPELRPRGAGPADRARPRRRHDGGPLAGAERGPGRAVACGAGRRSGKRHWRPSTARPCRRPATTWRSRSTHWRPAAAGDGRRPRSGRRATSPAAAGSDLLDASPVGVWLLEPTGERVVVWPTTPTAVWRSLARLMPGDAELAAP